MFQIQDMFENGKPDIVLKTVKRFNIKLNSCYNFDFKKCVNLGIAVLVMFNKMLVIVFIIDFYSGWAGIPKTQSFNLCPFLTLSNRNGPSVSFGTNSPGLTKYFCFICIYKIYLNILLTFSVHHYTIFSQNLSNAIDVTSNYTTLGLHIQANLLIYIFFS